ncbi:MAG: LamG-like jellyroll fold domain-containing protein [Phycisphaerales bacterium]
MFRFVVAASLAALGVTHVLAQQCTGQVGHWRFDGDTLDSSGLANHGVFFGSTPTYVAGISGEALELNGTTDFVRVANASSLNPISAMSLVAWLKPRAFSGSGSDPIIDKGYFGHSFPYYQYQLNVTGNLYGSSPASLGFYCGASGTPFGAGTAAHFWNPNQWYFVVGTYDGAAVRFYANGELIDQHAASGSLADYGKPVQFGKFNNLEYYLPATIDEIRIFDRALSADEIHALYSNPADAAAVWPPASGVCAGGSASFQALHLASANPSYSWTIDGVPALDGALPNGIIVSGSTAQTLTLSNVVGAGTHAIGCSITSCSGTSAATVATIKVCAADFNCDAQVDDSDFVLFVTAYNELVIPPANPLCDINGDSFVDDADFVLFAAAYDTLVCGV